MSEVNDAVKLRVDGWYNILTGVGMKAYDKRMNSAFSMSEMIDDGTLIDIYRGDGLGKKIIDIPVNDMVRNWFRIEADSDNKILNYLSKLNVKKYFKSALRWNKLFGGSILFMGIDDGQLADQPVNESQVKGIRFFQVYDRRRITWFPDDLYKDPKDEKYGEPKIYTINNASTGMPFRVHESRCIVFKGEDLPDVELASQRGWGDSRIQSVYSRLRGVCESLDGIEGINTDFIIGVMKVSNLQQLLSSKEGEQILRDRLHAMDMTKHSLNTIVVDKNEEFERASSFGVTGLRDLVDILVDVVCGISGIPRIKLIGDQTKGLGGTAEGNIRLYYDDISAAQDDELLPGLNKLVNYVLLSSEVEVDLEENWGIVFNKLYQQSEKEEAETKLLNAKSDSLYVDMGMPAEYVIASRFGGQTYGHDILIPQEYSDKLEASDITKLAKRIEEKIEASKKQPLSEMKSNGTDPGQTSKDNPGAE